MAIPVADQSPATYNLHQFLEFCFWDHLYLVEVWKCQIWNPGNRWYRETTTRVPIITITFGFHKRCVLLFFLVFCVWNVTNSFPYLAKLFVAEIINLDHRKSWNSSILLYSLKVLKRYLNCYHIYLHITKWYHLPHSLTQSGLEMPYIQLYDFASSFTEP